MRKTALLVLFLALPFLAACQYIEKRPSTVTLNNSTVITCVGGLRFLPDGKWIECYKEDGVLLLTVFWDNVKGYTTE